ncbi:hypothetical protein HDU88_006213 [Geranomyces variabilis]|nr:hypothetical protein HDU88_006213 [Geranomyces variabilis]
MTSTTRSDQQQLYDTQSGLDNNRNPRQSSNGGMGVEPFRVGPEFAALANGGAGNGGQQQQRPPPAPHALLIEPKQQLKLKSSAGKEKLAPRIGPYVVGRRLGEGSTGYVKLGVHQTTGLKVAIKIIGKANLMSTTSASTSSPDESAPMTPAATPSSREAPNSHMRKLEREIAIMKLIKHENIVQILDVYESDSELFLILEYTEGGELFDYMVTKGKLSHYETVVFLQQIMNAVEYCQRYNICHRDLKPENILLDKDNNIKIADFGMASIQGPGQMLETSCGSPHYASPEIIRGVKYDGGKSDIWSCGVIFFAMVTGRLPFDNDNIRKVLMMVKNGTYFIPKTVAPDAADLIKRMLVVDPWKRITMEEILEHPFMTSTKTRVMPNPPMVPPAPLSINSVAEIEPEILESLAVLGWSDERRLVSELTTPEDNQVKQFYHLMLQRRTDVLEDYQLYETSSYAGNPKRRGSSYMCLSAGPGSPLASPWTSRNELSSRTDLRSSSTATGEVSAGDQQPPQMQQQRSRAELRRAADGGAGPTPTSAVGDSNADVFRSSIAATSSPDTPRRAAASTTPAPTTPSSKTPKDRPLHITIPNSNSDAAGGNNNLLQQQSQFLGSNASLTAGPLSGSTTPGGGARGSWTSGDTATGDADGEDMKKLDITRFHRSRMTGPPTPTISSPKRSLLSSMFNFKPAPISFKSILDYEKTQMLILTLLASFGMKSVEQANNGGWNCAGEFAAGSSSSSSSNGGGNNSSFGGNSAVRKSIKYHVGIAADSGDAGSGGGWSATDDGRGRTQFKITLTQTQGSNSAFKKFASSLTNFYDRKQILVQQGLPYSRLLDDHERLELEQHGVSGSPAHSRSSHLVSTTTNEKTERTPL